MEDSYILAGEILNHAQVRSSDNEYMVGEILGQHGTRKCDKLDENDGHQTNCFRVYVEWQGGTIDWEHTSRLKVDITSITDKACFLYLSLILDGLVISDGDEILGKQPYLVIGDFAYCLGHDGSYYMTPVKPGRCPNWWRAAEIITDAKTDGMDFPVNRLGNLISDLGNISDIMHQSGVKTETP
jgi:hypothetical protein